jgi:hypothetical protein
VCVSCVTWCYVAPPFVPRALVLRARHESLLLSYEPSVARDTLQATSHVWMSIRNDGYILHYVVHHLLHCGKLETVRRLMMLCMNWIVYKTHVRATCNVQRATRNAQRLT